MSQTKICRYCGEVIYSDEEKCEYCGKYLCKEHDNPELFCQKCKAPVNTDDNFCQNCGAIFNLPSEDDNSSNDYKHNIAGIPYNIGILLKSFAASFAITVFFNAGKETTLGQDFIFFIIAFIAAEIFLYIYFLPTIIAIEKNNHNSYLIYICNLLFGITIIGWIVSLIFAMRTKQNNI